MSKNIKNSRKNEMRIIILVANSTYYPSNLMVPVILSTWGKDKRVKTLIYQGGAEVPYHTDEKIFLDIDNSYESASEKTKKVFEYVYQNFEFDFLFRVTTTAYINIENLIKFLDTISQDKCYLGVLDYYPPVRDSKTLTIPFISGAGLILSRDIVEIIISNSDKYDINLLDDVALGKLLIKELKIEPKLGFREDYYKNIPSLNEINPEGYHFRFKLGVNYIPRFLEVIVLVNLFLKFKWNVFNSKFLKQVFNFIDQILKIIFVLFKLFNLNFIKYKFNKMTNKLYRFFVKLIKSNKFTYGVAKRIKNND